MADLALGSTFYTDDEILHKCADFMLLSHLGNAHRYEHEQHFEDILNVLTYGGYTIILACPVYMHEIQQAIRTHLLYPDHDWTYSEILRTSIMIDGPLDLNDTASCIFSGISLNRLGIFYGSLLSTLLIPIRMWRILQRGIFLWESGLILDPNRLNALEILSRLC